MLKVRPQRTLAELLHTSFAMCLAYGWGCLAVVVALQLVPMVAFAFWTGPVTDPTQLPTGGEALVINLIEIGMNLAQEALLTSLFARGLSGRLTSFSVIFSDLRLLIGRLLACKVVAAGWGFLFGCLLVVPGLIYVVRRSLVVPVIMSEQVSGLAPLDRSRDLVERAGPDCAWRIFAVLAGTYCADLVVGSLVGAFVFVVVTPDFRWAFIVRSVVTLGFIPMRIACLTLIYWDVRDHGQPESV